MEEDKLWKIMTPNTWNVALNAKTETNDFEQLNYGFECLWEEWLWRPIEMVALNAQNSNSERQWEKWL